MKILIVIDRFNVGGGARVVSRLLDGFVANGHEVIMATNIMDKEVMYPIPDEVKLVQFKATELPKKHSAVSSLKMHIKCIKDCKKLYRDVKPDVIVAEMATVFMWCYVASLGTGIPLIAHDHTSFSRILNRVTNFIRFHLYGQADALVILSERDRRILINKFPNKVVIYNPLPFEPINMKTTRRKSILVVGRFDVWKVKGFDIIVDIFSNIADKFPEWNLEFAGSGTDESVSYIKRLVHDKGIENRTIFHGQISNIKELYQQVEIFALPSRVEGLPMGLMEAMSQGCACVAFEVGGATNEMITQGESGYCIPDGEIPQFEQALENLMADDKLRSTLSANAIKESQKFSLDIISSQWESLFKSLCNSGN